jgi:hypothetical protein
VKLKGAEVRKDRLAPLPPPHTTNDSLPTVLPDKAPHRIGFRMPSLPIGRTVEGKEEQSVVFEDVGQRVLSGAAGRRMASRWVVLKFTRERVKGS